MTMLDSDFNGSQQKSAIKKAEQHKFDIPFEQQAEKKMQVYEAAQRLNYAAWVEWMHDKNYQINKL